MPLPILISVKALVLPRDVVMNRPVVPIVKGVTAMACGENAKLEIDDILDGEPGCAFRLKGKDTLQGQPLAP